ncbi:hypothetical protein Tco_0853884 [Tanacetum coccineum]
MHSDNSDAYTTRTISVFRGDTEERKSVGVPIMRSLCPFLREVEVFESFQLYVNRKKLAERRPVSGGQFVRRLRGLTLSAWAATTSMIFGCG